MKNSNTKKPLVIIQCYEDRQQTLPLRRVENASNGVVKNGSNGIEKNVINGVVKNTPNGVIKNVSNGVVKNLSNGTMKSVSNGVAKNDQQLKREATDNPPPPPPMPNTNGLANGHQNGNCKVAELSNQINNPAQVDLKAPNLRKNGVLTRTPTPDYNNKIDSTLVRKVKEDKAELDSLESYKLKNPASAPPKPPSNYFVTAPNGTATMKKHTRPVSVTIGEYTCNGASRREPTKLEFLNGDKPDGPSQLDNVEETSISNRLQSELVLTLSRSNLRKKTDALDRRVVDQKTSSKVLVTFNGDSDTSMDQNFHARYGNNLLPLPPSVNIPKVSKTLNKIIAN